METRKRQKTSHVNPNAKLQPASKEESKSEQKVVIIKFRDIQGEETGD